MKPARALLLLGLISLPSLRAVYAPIPEQEQGKEITVSLAAGATYDNNIFGAAHGARESMIYEAAPKIAFNASLTDQTFASASYELTLDHYDNRPGEKDLDSHDFIARIAHAFSPATTLDLTDEYQINKNPESLLNGIAVNTEQSFKRNGFDGRFTTTVTEKAGVVLKFRSTDYSYDDDTLGQSLDRTENLYGFSGTYALLPETKLIGEYRREDISYRVGGSGKDKQTDFAIGGFDYNIAKKLTASTRVGYTWRHRDSQPSATAPYAELSGKYDFGERAYVSGGYSYTFEETSNIALYNDTKVNRFFVNVQQPLAATVVASGSLSYEPSQLQRRGGGGSVAETTTRAGLAVTWFAQKNLSLAATYDHDDVQSDDPTRGQIRDRVGVNATYTF